MLNQSEGVLKMLSIEFARLREIAAFDNSLIFVLGDHGACGLPMIGLKHEAVRDIGLAIDPAAAPGPVSSVDIQGGIPLVLVKGIGDEDPFRISRAPVELGDVPNTVFHALGLVSAADGPSMFDLSDQSLRVRAHRHYEFSGWGQDYILPMVEYSVTGFSWNPASWSSSGHDLNRNALASIDGTLIVLGEGGNLDEFDHWGWSEPKSQGRLVAGARAAVTLPPRVRSDRSTLQFRFSPIRSPQERGSLRLLINDEVIGVYPFYRGAPNALSARIPGMNYGDDTELTVGFELEATIGPGPLLIEIREIVGRQS
jgi:hypothetical protein